MAEGPPQSTPNDASDTGIPDTICVPGSILDVPEAILACFADSRARAPMPAASADPITSPYVDHLATPLTARAHLQHLPYVQDVDSAMQVTDDDAI